MLMQNSCRTFLPENNYPTAYRYWRGRRQREPAEFANEREILYKLFFDMKKDVNELKKMFFDLLQNPSMAQQCTGLYQR